MVSANASNGHPGHLDPKQQHMVYKLREDVSTMRLTRQLKAKGYYAADRHDDACSKCLFTDMSSVPVSACPQVGLPCG